MRRPLPTLPLLARAACRRLQNILPVRLRLLDELRFGLLELLARLEERKFYWCGVKHWATPEYLVALQQPRAARFPLIEHMHR